MFDAATGTFRSYLDRDVFIRLCVEGSVAVDGRRTRPLWFDGRFLTARDLSREQLYNLTRHADLAVGLGPGVISGLELHISNDNATEIRVSTGTAITTGGESVVVGKELKIDLADLPAIQAYNQQMGFDEHPAIGDHARSGIFIVVLRPVAFTADPIGAYASEIGAERIAEDGEVVDATVATLIPFRERPIDGGDDRAFVAAELFRDGVEPTLPPGVVPLGMVAVERNQVRWVDPWLMRRTVGQQSGFAIGAAGSNRPQAHLAHYVDFFAEKTDELSGSGNPAFPAQRYFRCLPPVGPMPPGCIAVDTQGGAITQTWLPPEVSMELSLAPADELPLIVDEAGTLPPIDLDADPDELSSLSVLVVVPVERRVLRGLRRQLGGQTLKLNTVGSRRVAADLLINLKETLMRRRLRRGEPAVVDDAETPPPTTLAAWAQLINGAEEMWFVRRRTFNHSSPIVGTSASIGGTDDENEDGDPTMERLEEWGLDAVFDKALENTQEDRLRVLIRDAVDEPRMRKSALLTGGFLFELAAGPVDRARYRNVVLRHQRLSDELLAFAKEFNSEQLRALAETRLIPEFNDLLTDDKPGVRALAAETVGTLLKRGTPTPQLRKAIQEIITKRDESDLDSESPIDPALMERFERFDLAEVYEKSIETVGEELAPTANNMLRTGAARSLNLAAAGIMMEIIESKPRSKEDLAPIAKRYAVNGFGVGLKRLGREAMDEPQILRTFAASGMIPELDAVMQRLPAGELEEIREKLIEIAQAGQIDAMKEIITDLGQRRERPSPGGGGTLRSPTNRGEATDRDTNRGGTTRDTTRGGTPNRGGNRGGTTRGTTRGGATRGGATRETIVRPGGGARIREDLLRLREQPIRLSDPEDVLRRTNMTRSFNNALNRAPQLKEQALKVISQPTLSASDLAITAYVMDLTKARNANGVGTRIKAWTGENVGSGLAKLDSSLLDGNTTVVNKRTKTFGRLSRLAALDKAIQSMAPNTFGNFKRKFIEMLDARRPDIRAINAFIKDIVE